jgi:uncharacterized protein (DUF3820 family)
MEHKALWSIRMHTIFIACLEDDRHRGHEGLKRWLCEGSFFSFPSTRLIAITIRRCQQAPASHHVQQTQWMYEEMLSVISLYLNPYTWGRWLAKLRMPKDVKARAAKCVVLALCVLLAGELPPVGLANQDAAPEAAKCLITFGKHRGKRVSEVPRNYLEWVVKEGVYANRPELAAALRSLKLLSADGQTPPSGPKKGETQQQHQPTPPKLPLKKQQSLLPPPPCAHGEVLGHGPASSASGGGTGRENRVLGSHAAPAPTLQGPLDAFFRLPGAGDAIADATDAIQHGGGGGGGNATEPYGCPQVRARDGREAPGRSVSVELLTPRHVAVYGIHAAEGGAAHSNVLKMLRKLPFAAFNQTARGWSVRVEDYGKLVSAFKANGLLVSSKGGKSASVHRPPESMIKALASGAWPLLNVSEVHRILRCCLPEQLRAALLPFQVEGVMFGIGRGGRCLLADEMGLGKTVQALAIAACFRSDWPLLVVCPSSLRLNWKHELERWLPGEEVQVMLNGLEVDARLSNATLPPTTIISYDLLASRRGSRLLGRWGFLILDESHYIKNPKSLRSKACLPLIGAARRALLLSGTPALSRPAELFTQLSGLQPQMFSSRRAFEDRFCDRKQGRFGVDVSGASNLAELNMVLGHTVMIRRLKRDVLTQLPHKRRQQVYLQVSPRQAAALQKSLALLDQIQKATSLGAPLPGAGEDEGGGEEGWETAAAGGEEEEEVQARVRGKKGGDKVRHKRDALIAQAYKQTGLAKLDAAVDYLLTLLEGGVDKVLVFAHHL